MSDYGPDVLKRVKFVLIKAEDKCCIRCAFNKTCDWVAKLPGDLEKCNGGYWVQQ